MTRLKRCRICKKEGYIYLRHANLPLCKEHFISRVHSVVQDTIKKYEMFSKKEKILVAVSGGKDSLALWHILKELGYDTEGFHIDLGLGEFSNVSKQISENFAEKHGIKLNIFSLEKELGSSMENIIEKSYEKPCSLCGTVKRHLMNKIAYEMGHKVIATGHNLDDEASRLLGNILSWQEEYLYRQYPVLPEEEVLVRKVKPLVFLSRKELLMYCKANEIEYADMSCPYSKGARSLVLLDVIEKIEERYPATKIRFVRGFYKLRERFKPSQYVELHKCPGCGIPTASEKELCRFCRIKERVKRDVLAS